MREVIHLSTVFTKKEKKKQKKKERTATTNLNSRNFCVDKREQLILREKYLKKIFLI